MWCQGNRTSAGEPRPRYVDGGSHEGPKQHWRFGGITIRPNNKDMKPSLHGRRRGEYRARIGPSFSVGVRNDRDSFRRRELPGNRRYNGERIDQSSLHRHPDPQATAGVGGTTRTMVPAGRRRHSTVNFLMCCRAAEIINMPLTHMIRAANELSLERQGGGKNDEQNRNQRGALTTVLPAVGPQQK